MALDASTGDAAYVINAHWPISPDTAIEIGCSDAGLVQEFIRRSGELPEKLRNLDSINDDNSIDEDGFDGVALEEVTPYGGVDEFA